MPMLELTDNQVLELVKQLSPERQRAALVALAGGAEQRGEKQRLAEAELRRLCAARGKDWDAMPEEEREAFIDDLVHEDRR